MPEDRQQIERNNALAFALLFGSFIAVCGLYEFGAVMIFVVPWVALPPCILGALYLVAARLGWTAPISRLVRLRLGIPILILAVLVLHLSCLVELRLRSSEAPLSQFATVDRTIYNAFGPRAFAEYQIAPQSSARQVFDQYGAVLASFGWHQESRRSEPSFEYSHYTRDNDAVVMKAYPGLGSSLGKESIMFIVELFSPKVAFSVSLAAIATLFALGFFSKQARDRI